MLIQGAAGALPSTRQTSGNPTLPVGTFGEVYTSELAPAYYSLVKAGRVFTVSGAGVNGSAFVGGAAGTPLIGLYNPANSGVDLAIISATYAFRTTGTAAASTDINFWMANQSAPVTGTQTQARNIYTQLTAGSSAWAMVNTANTGAAASALVRPSLSIGTTAASPTLSLGVMVDEIRGGLVVAPGCYLALGQSVALTAASLDVSLTWAEIPA
jgi:hypothetical protein